MKILGNLICQNGIHEILRCIESVAPIVDKYIIVDGGSIDGTWEVLQRYKKAYNLTLYQHTFDGMDKQRNYMLSLCPKDSWIVSIDQDEKINNQMMLDLRDFLLNYLKPEQYVDDTRVNPYTLGIPMFNLNKDLKHTSDDEINLITEKVFWYDRNLHFVKPYHSTISYNNTEGYKAIVSVPLGWAIIHYAYLDQARLDSVDKDITSGKRDYSKEEWKKRGSTVVDFPIHLL